MNNSWTIRVPNKINSCSRKQFVRPPKNESRLDEPIHEHWWRGTRKECAEKTNNFERFFGDSALTFLTFGNTYRLVILPTRCLVLLRGRERKIWGRQIKIRGRQIFPGSASKTPILKGKWRKKGGAEAPPISLYKYNTFHRQKQEVLKPKKRLGCGKGFSHEIMEATPPDFTPI